LIPNIKVAPRILGATFSFNPEILLVLERIHIGIRTGVNTGPLTELAASKAIRAAVRPHPGRVAQKIDWIDLLHFQAYIQIGMNAMVGLNLNPFFLSHFASKQ